MSSGHEQFNRALARLLHTLRVSAGLPQEVLASQLRWDQATVSRIETGRRKVEVAELLAWVEETNADSASVFNELAEAWSRRSP